MHEYTQAIVTVLSLINPMICAALFAKLSKGESAQARIVDATKAALAIVVILSLAAFCGSQILTAFGISLPAFQVAGGLVLIWMGFMMLRGTSSPTSPDEDSEEMESEKKSLTPLILFAASPGTITGVITLSVAHSQDGIPLTALVAIVVAMALTWIVMVVTSSKGGGQKKSGLVHDVTSRFMGLIVLAMGVQFALAGFSEFSTPEPSESTAEIRTFEPPSPAQHLYFDVESQRC